MRILSTFSLSVVLLATFVFGSQPVSNLQVTLRGKKYDVSDVTTVKDLQKSVEKDSGLEAHQQGRVLFGGKRLAPTDILSDVGVSDGAQLNIIPETAKTKTKKSSAATAATATASSTTTTDSAATDAAANPMQDYLKKAGIDPKQVDEFMKGMGGSGEGMPSMEESMETMIKMMDSILNDPEKMEQARQMFLNNPMLKSMMGGMPGMEELLNDPTAWREAMQAVASMYKNLDGEQLKQAMTGGMGGINPAGLFDGTLDNSAAAAALDELDEED